MVIALYFKPVSSRLMVLQGNLVKLSTNDVVFMHSLIV